MTGKLDEMSDPTEALYVADPSMSIGTHTPLNWRRGKVPGDDEQVYFFLTADPSYLTSFSISSYAFETPEALTDERTQAWFSWGFDQYIHTQLHVAEQDFVFDVATPVQIGTIEGSEAPMPGYVAPFAIHRDGYTIYGKYYAFLAGPHGYICTLTSLPAFWEEAPDLFHADVSVVTATVGNCPPGHAHRCRRMAQRPARPLWCQRTNANARNPKVPRAVFP